MARGGGRRPRRVRAVSSRVESRPPLNATTQRGSWPAVANRSIASRNAARNRSLGDGAGESRRAVARSAGRGERPSGLFERPIVGETATALQEQGLDGPRLDVAERALERALDGVGCPLRIAMRAAERLGD